MGKWLVWQQLPDEPFPNFRASKSGDREFYAVRERRAADFKAPKLWKGSSGMANGLNRSG